MITSEVSADELDMDDFYMIRNNNQVKDKYKAIIDKGEKCQMNLKDALKGSTLTDGKTRINKGKKCQINLKYALKGSTLTAGTLYI